MIHKQGSEYKDSAEVEEAILEDDAQRKKASTPKRVLFIVLGVLGAILVLFVISAVFNRDTTPVDDPVSSNDPMTVIGDDDYWSQFDDPDTMFTYTDKEIADLRAWGYTGDEIEENEENEVPAEELIAASRQAQEEARATLSNPESPEYQALLNNTWLGQQAISIPGYTEDVTEGQIWYDTITLNADYEKVPAHGYNLFLKVYLDDTSYAFMECPLVRYMQLADSGNIVVQYRTATIDGTTIVFEMKEVVVQ